MSEFDVLIMGANKVGKTCLASLFAIKEFLQFHDPTIEDSYRVDPPSKIAAIKNFSVIDTSGEFEKMCNFKDLIVNARGFVLVYSNTDPSSANKIKTLISDIKAQKSDTAACNVTNYITVMCNIKVESDKAAQHILSETCNAENIQHVAFNLSKKNCGKEVNELFINLSQRNFKLHSKCINGDKLWGKMPAHADATARKKTYLSSAAPKKTSTYSKCINGDKSQGIFPAEGCAAEKMQQYLATASNENTVAQTLQP